MLNPELWPVVMLLISAQSPANGVPSAADKQRESAAKQIASTQGQTGAAPGGSFFSSAWAGPPLISPAGGNCPVLPSTQAEPLIEAAAARHKVDARLLTAVITQESAFYPCAVSDKGAMGLMQIMPETARALKVRDPFDPADNIDSGALYLRQMLDRYGNDTRLALAAYNAGPEKVDSSKPEIPNIPETHDYVESIMRSLGDGSSKKTEQTSSEALRQP